MKKALITGVTGQDGAYLSAHLLKLGYEVVGVSTSTNPNLRNLELLGIRDSFPIARATFSSEDDVKNLIRVVEPTHIFALGALSSVSASFANPSLAENSIFRTTKVFLESVKLVNPEILFFHPSSSEMFGNIETRATEETDCNPVSPYGFWKLKTHELVAQYRKDFGLKCVNGILFNHESPLRGNDFFTRKLIKGVVGIHLGEIKSIEFGNLHGVRDWGWAPDYVVAMEMLVNAEVLQDLVIASGVGYSLQDLVTEAFALLGYDWQQYVKINKEFFRPLDIKRSVGNPTKAEKNLPWKNTKSMSEIVENLLESELSRARK